MTVKKAKQIPDFYIGIDLGTTNCSAASGNERRDGTFLVDMISFKMQHEKDSWRHKQLLPSFVYFPSDEDYPQVGPKAKNMLLSQHSRVIKSIKSLMGKKLTKKDLEKLYIDNKQYTPTDISAILLQTILTGIKYSFGLEIDDVVITVPASFDSDMRAATLKAAEKAGIKIKNEDGTVRDILLDEPRASLYDFINHQKLGNIGTQIIDFSIPKNILVYDLGGGTLDVSLHRVGYKNPEDNIIDIEDIAISRYLNLGGDVFDETLRDYLYKEYFRRTNLDEKNWGKYELEAIKAKLLVFAENYKISITNRITHRQQYDENVNYLDFSETISSGYLLGTKLLTIDLSMKEYQNLLKHFFAPDISFPTEENINSFKPANDLIFPIIDVLQKGYHSKNRIIRPDIILLTGGMTRLHILKDRLKKFFGVEPSCILDPDKSVSRGASIYHYFLHQGYKPSQILAESILFEDKKGLKTIIPAGTVIPKSGIYKKKLDIPWALNDPNRTKYTLPFYRSDKDHPLLKRYFELSRPYPKGTEIGAEVEINSQKIITFNVWVKDDSGSRLEEAQLKIDIESETSKPIKKLEETATEEEETNLKGKIIHLLSGKKLTLEQIIRKLNLLNESEKKLELQDLLKELEDLHLICKSYEDDIPIFTTIIESDKIQAQKYVMRTRTIPVVKIRNLLIKANKSGKLFSDELSKDDILSAKNRINLIRTILKQMRRIKNPRVKDQIYLFLGEVSKNQEIKNTNHDLMLDIHQEMNHFLEFLIDHPNPQKILIDKGLRYAIETLGKIGMIDRNRKVIKNLFAILKDDLTFLSVKFAVFVTLGKIPSDPEIVKELIAQWDDSKTSKSDILSLLWAIGKQCSRDSFNPIFYEHFHELIAKILELLNQSEDYEILQKCAYSLMELNAININDSLNQVDDMVRNNTLYSLESKKDKLLLNISKFKATSNNMHAKLKQLGRHNATIRMFDVALKKISGQQLTEEENEVLFAIREQ